MNSNGALIVPPSPMNPVAATNDIRAIKPPLEIAGQWTWLWWLLGIVALILIGLAAWFYWRSRRRVATPAVVIPAHVRAKERLQRALALLHDPREFCIEVSTALRVYLEERFDFHAPERTTEEFLEELKATSLLSVDQKESLTDFLQRCDLVKFARHEPPEIELKELHDAALRLIDETQFEKLESMATLK